MHETSSALRADPRLQPTHLTRTQSQPARSFDFRQSAALHGFDRHVSLHSLQQLSLQIDHAAPPVEMEGGHKRFGVKADIFALARHSFKKS